MLLLAAGAAAAQTAAPTPQGNADVIRVNVREVMVPVIGHRSEGTPLRSVLADGREYYLLAYVPNNTAQDGSFHGITVEVTDKKLRVRAKAGYWAGAAKD